MFLPQWYLTPVAVPQDCCCVSRKTAAILYRRQNTSGTRVDRPVLQNRPVLLQDAQSVVMCRLETLTKVDQTVRSLFSFFFCRHSPQWARASSFTRFLDHTQRRTTLDRTPLDEWSSRRGDLYLTSHNTHNRETSIPPGGIRTHNLSRRAAADLRLRPPDHWSKKFCTEKY
jgi:hypothetical protein